MFFRQSILLALAFSASGCSGGLLNLGLPRTPGEVSAAYGYVPLDPLPVDTSYCRFGTKIYSSGADGRPAASKNPLRALPDQTIRFAVASFDQTKGSLTFGPTQLTLRGGQYRAVLDYINSDSIPFDVYIRARVAKIDEKGELQTGSRFVPLGEQLNKRIHRIVGYEAIASDTNNTVSRLLADSGVIEESDISNKRLYAFTEEKEKFKEYTLVTIPIYVGIGLRLSADVLSLQGGATLSGLGVIGAEAEANRVTGTLTVQSLGVSGKSIASALPLPSKLDRTTIENSILAIGTMRASLYQDDDSSDKIERNARLVGLFSPVGSDALLINAVYTELARTRPKWITPC